MSPRRLLFYLEGGGGCFSAETCGLNPTFVTTLPAGGADPGTGGRRSQRGCQRPDRAGRFSALIGGTGEVREKILADEDATEVEGTRLHEWLADLVAGEDVPDVRCTDCR